MKTIQQRAIERQRKLEAKRQDARYQRVVGRLALEKLIVGKGIRPTHTYPTLEEALWVGEEIEPRILELLPAVLLRRPKLFMQPKGLPEDLLRVVQELKRGAPVTPFRGIPPEKYASWVDRLGRRRKGITITKTHRFTGEDLEALQVLKRRWNVDETAAIRRAIAIALKT